MCTSEPAGQRSPECTIVHGPQSPGVRTCFVSRCRCWSPVCCCRVRPACGGAGRRHRHRGDDLSGRGHARTGARFARDRCRRTSAQLFSARHRGEALRRAAERRHRAAAERGFRIDVFEAPALECARRQSRCRDRRRRPTPSSRAIWAGAWWPPTSRRPRSTKPTIDKIMNGEITAPSTPKRDATIRQIGTCLAIHRVHRADLPQHGPGGGGRHRRRRRLGPGGGRRESRANPAKPAAPLWSKACARRCAAIWPTATAT